MTETGAHALAIVLALLAITFAGLAMLHLGSLAGLAYAVVGASSGAASVLVHRRLAKRNPR